MADPSALVSERLAAAFAAVAGAPVDPVVRLSDHADVQANGALAVAKTLGRSPRDVAVDVIAAADLESICSSVEVAGPGFINLTFEDSFLASLLAEATADARCGVRPAEHVERVVIDYSAPNVAKEMHIGHLRTTVIGDALARLLDFIGHDVVRENHIGDWGRPFGMLIEHLIDIGRVAGSEGLDVEAIELRDLDEFYRTANAKLESSEEFTERARQRVVLLQSGDPETLRLWRLLVARSTAHFNEVYAKLGVLLTDADLAGESTYDHLLPEVVRRLEEAGLLTCSDGADVVFPPGFVNREGDPLPLIVRNSVGGFNYGTSDLACVIDRVERLGATLLLYVVDSGQAQHLQMVFAVAEMAGWLRPPTTAVHVGFGTVLGADRKRMRSRSGEPVKFIDVIDEAIDRAGTLIAAKNPDLDADERASVARAAGVGALKYADLSTDRIKDYVFDWDRMLSFDGNTAPYLQYAHARICSIFRRAGVDPMTLRGRVPVIGAAEERALVIRLLGFEAAVRDSIDKYALHRLCTYLFELAQDFTAFYEACPVLRAPDDVLRTSRLAVCGATAMTLSIALDLLGIGAPERM